MWRNLKFLLSFLVLWLCLGGCAHIGDFSYEAPQKKLLIQATDALRADKIHQARELLERLIDMPPLGGVTDEALFRLALLSLLDEGAVKAGSHAEALLERLKKEFPDSIWSFQSKSLLSYMAGIKSLRDKRRQLKTVQDLNLSLSRENRELRQSLERLKQLDLELEQKIR